MKYCCRKSTAIFFNFPLIPTSSADPENFPRGGGLGGLMVLLSLLRHIFWQFYNVIEFCRSNDLSPLDLGMRFDIAWMIEHTMHTMGGNSHLQQL